ncbi:MAG TPA: hypothetical protein VFQ54_01730 [Thermomicrobiales bacterium]|nr:hypothetical protein [Thermomicrobiales bacterium]
MVAKSDRILTTHTGSLPRPKDLIPMLYARDRGEAYDEVKIAERTHAAVSELVARQREVGIDVVNDGEAGKVLYSTYVQDRLTGYTGTAPAPQFPSLEAQEFPEFYERLMADFKDSRARIAACEGPVTYRGFSALSDDLANLKDAIKALGKLDEVPAGVFISAASPGIIATYLPDQYYGDDEKYVNAIAAAMKTEYDAIHYAGFILQLDCPDLAFEYTKVLASGRGLSEFRAMVEYRVAALNEATRDIPADRMRMHICWGNGATPHHYDVPLKDIVDLILEARPA